MKKILITILICIACVACGVKDKPEYQSQKNFNKTINLI